MIPGSRNKSFVLPMTLTEVAILLFFLLLFTAVHQIQRATSEREELERLVAQRGEIRPEKVQSLLEAARQEEEVEALQKKLAEAEAKNRGLDSLLAIREEVSDETFDELVRRAAQGVRDEGAAERLRERIAAAEQSRDSMQSALQNCQAQNLNCSNRLQEAGLGHPPCWADEEGKPEYIYTVGLVGDSLEVRPTWPSHRVDDARRVDGALSLAGETLSRQAFSARAEPILRWSQRQEPECRHFVVIDDAEMTTKEDFKESLLLVENFFYKYLPRN